ncbi:unnamed protein product [Schistosoma margrebowiei]|uniref:Uncharacterized protein n=1 Tax=Schistosoma margrebowiei TaxID=48269 RepID=A0A183MBZ7_9TREM|nr:unnamed protein product [Schistosoma margrebowiei]
MAVEGSQQETRVQGFLLTSVVHKMLRNLLRLLLL